MANLLTIRSRIERLEKINPPGRGGVLSMKQMQSYFQRAEEADQKRGRRLSLGEIIGRLEANKAPDCLTDYMKLELAEQGQRK